MQNAQERRDEVIVIDRNYLDRYWPQAIELLGPSVKYCHGKYDLQDIYEMVNNETAFLWLTYQSGYLLSAGITWVDIYPKSRTLTLGFAGGDMDGLIAMIPDIKSYAKQLQCDGIECQGRSGWQKVLKPYGFDKVSVTTRMEVAI